MRLICGPPAFLNSVVDATALKVALYGQAAAPARASAGEAARYEFRRSKLAPSARAWDFVTIALAVVTADFAVFRKDSPDGWTREIELDIAVIDPEFWSTQSDALAKALGFLTTDRWRLRFGGGSSSKPTPPSHIHRPSSDCVMLLSGGLDSLVGALDLAALGHKPFAVSQTVRGDAQKQIDFAAQIGGGMRHIQLNHNAAVPGQAEDSQRARSLVFIAFAVAVATSLKSYGYGVTPVYVCENGFIAMNAPLTGMRVGSLSTRTAHPEYLAQVQGIMDAAGLRVELVNPYATMTKGEMLQGCRDQRLLTTLAAASTSCGRFQRFNYRHCGRCVPCQVRRAAFLRCGHADQTTYIYDALGRDDDENARFDDVRAVAMALAQVRSEGLDSWLGSALASPHLDREATRNMLGRGLEELAVFHKTLGVA